METAEEGGEEAPPEEVTRAGCMVTDPWFGAVCSRQAEPPGTKAADLGWKAFRDWGKRSPAGTPRRHKHHQWFTQNIGHPKLREHLSGRHGSTESGAKLGCLSTLDE